MKRILVLAICLFSITESGGWGFYAHRQINQYAVYLLPPEMLLFYKRQIPFLHEHAVDPDKRRYAVAAEGPRHFIDIDHYGSYPYTALPRKWEDAVQMYGEDSLNKYGIAPWWIQTMLFRLTKAMREKNSSGILRLSAELGHYLGDIHVPLHASSNHNGQHTGQHGIHGFWESRVPELLAAKEWDFFIGKADYIEDPLDFTWARVLESAAAADTVLKTEKALSQRFPPDRKYSFELRNGLLVRQYSDAYTREYDRLLKNMVERRMRQSVYAVASFWYTAWVNAGQPELGNLTAIPDEPLTNSGMDSLSLQWKSGKIIGKECL